MIGRTPRAWIWTAVAIQAAGLVFDVGWHGLNRSFDPVTVPEMLRHLATVHLPIYIGAVNVFLTTAWALIDRMRRSGRGAALPIAFAGACLSLGGEAWHAYHHLQLSTHGGAIAGMTSFVGLVVVVGALLASGRLGGPAPRDVDHHRAV